MLSFCEVACRFAQYIFSSVSSKEDSLTNGEAHQKSLNVLFSGNSEQHLTVETYMFVNDILDRFYVLKKQEN
jgi:hypothetical protein